MSNVRTTNSMTVVSKGRKRGRDGQSIRVAEVIFEGRTYHVQYDHRVDGWTASMKHPVNPGMVFSFAP